MTRTNHLPGLDGIRALCALVILWGHIPQADFCDWGGAFSDISFYFPPCCAYIFFVLSGFLAGYKSGDGFNVRDYYRKRAKKILPVYYGYIVVTVLAFWGIGLKEEVLNTRLLYYLFLVPGVPFCSAGGGVLPLVHLWFVGTVVLFYVVFPLFMRIKADDRPKAALAIAGGWAILKWALYLLAGKESFMYRFVSVTSFDSLFFGVLLGLLWKRGDGAVVRLGENRLVAVLVWALVLLSGFYGKYVPAPVRIEYMAVVSGLLMLNQVSARPVLSLDNKVLGWLGSISYEVYVVQILVIMLLSMLYVHAGWHWPWVVIMLMCTVVVAGVAKVTAPRKKPRKR